MKIAFFGTALFSSIVLEKLINKYDISYVVTQMDKKQGRGQKLIPTAVKEKAINNNIEVFQTDIFNKSFFEKLSKKPIDLAIVVAYGLYIPSYFITYPKYSCLNIHFSLLPKYRGAAPVARAIINGDKTTGVSIMKLAKEMDAGDILVSKEIKIEKIDTTETLSLKLTNLGTDLLIENIDNYINGKIKLVKQSELGIPSYANKILKEEKILNWNEEAELIERKIRAFNPWPIVETKLNNLNIKILKARVIYDNSDCLPGTIYKTDQKEGLLIAQTGKNSLLIEKVLPFGKREMNVSDFLNGYKIKEQMRFL